MKKYVLFDKQINIRDYHCLKNNSSEKQIEELALKIIEDFANTDIVVNDANNQTLKNL